MKAFPRRRLTTALPASLALLILVATLPTAYAAEDAQAPHYARAPSPDTAPGSVSATITVGPYEIRTDEQTHHILLENFGRLLVPGKPNLPSKIFALAIPPGARVAQVTFATGDGIVLPGAYRISPAPLPRVIGQEDPLLYERDKIVYEQNFRSVYAANSPYPPSVVEFVRAARYRKYNLVDVRVTPFTYYPQSGRLLYYPEITVHVTYTFPEDSRPHVTTIDDLPRTERIAQELILNYDQARAWYPATTGTRSGQHTFVIITLDTLASSVTALRDWEMTKGRTAEIVTTSWIASNYVGYDLAEQIRNFLRDKYPSGAWGVQDVLLVGHYDDLPMRRTWQDIGYGQPETDFYYAELSLPDDQSWDANGNHQYGETIWDPIDFYAEVNVGRIPWSTPSTVSSICQKSVAYEQNADPAFKKNILLLGAYFWEDTDCAVLMETKVDQPWMADWTMTRMYEQNADYWSSYACDYPLLNSNVTSVWSSGQYAFVNWAGHGSYISSHIYGLGAPAFINASDRFVLNDNYPAIIFADACSNSETDYASIGRAMLQRGAVGFLGATKVAYGMPAWDDPADGSSQSLDYFFTTGVTSGAYTQGEAHQWALRQMYTNGLWSNGRYEVFEWGALWGNPDLGMAPPSLNSPPETPAQPAGPSEGVAGVEHTFTAGAGDPEDHQVYYMWDWGNDDLSEWLGPYDSGEAHEAAYAWSDAGLYDVRVRAKDELEAVGEWSDPLSVRIVSSADLDADGDVDLDDFAVFAACYNGNSRPPAAACPPGVDADLDADGDVDLDDFAVFAANYTGGL